VILSGNPHLHHVYAKIYNAFGMAQRTFEIQAYYERMFGLLRAKESHPLVDFRHVIGPLREMATKITPMDYSREEVEKQIEFGEKDAAIFIEHDNEKRVQSPRVMASKDESFTYNCATRRQYMNPAKQAKHEQMCPD